MLLPNKESLRKNNLIRSLKRFANSNFVAKILIGALVWVIALIPAWIYLGVRFLINPFGFWQELAIFVIFAVVIGWAQFLLFMGGIILTVILIFEDL